MGRPPHACHPAALTRQSRVSRLWGAPDQVWAASNPYGPSLARKICRRQVKGLPARFGDGRPADDTSATLQRHFSDTSATLRRHFGDTSVPRAGPGVRGRPRLLRGSTGPSPAFFRGCWGVGRRGAAAQWAVWGVGASGEVRGRSGAAWVPGHAAIGHEATRTPWGAARRVGPGAVGRGPLCIHRFAPHAHAESTSGMAASAPPAGLVASLAEGLHLALGMQNQGFANLE